ncbi:BREX-1 system adenine-specific DNA-methyltransferase PglX [Aliivibrio fischeri]|uniref:BREX-1 system adenine-specific DNA-methyltransferase PglX n=1 Tax=Aliivibrio fischeri TaxID=668 RepID=UPI0010617DB3|nr:BREX-1 system adenine-specific DNA-methyltransferase PglX [Aliivibrio fischeri]TDM51626.1 BREX-1 system adenine-specific DNA-methyltransferase PglX [Aliivibrio fischeri]
MNTNKLKSYAPKARLAFMEAVTKRAAFLGLYADRIAEMTIDGDSAVIEGRVFTRKQGQQRSQLVQRIEALGTTNGKLVLKDGFNQFINETAFTWFNRLTAIRYMEVNEYLDHGFRVLSKSEGAQFGEGFEILGSAADVADDLGLNKESIIDMVLDGNKEEELYRTILLGQCHQLSEAMSFMFEKLDDATELLLPDNLTKTDSILKDLVNDIPEDNWQEIEVIGWLYQFYISEHKDAVIGKVVKREDIPAATQLFTPNWIVKYLVQNSLGRQWLATYPDSELKEKMAYYITPAEQSNDVIEQLKAITPTSIDPEEIKVLDPACGSGHILVEVYEVLREIYLERGYRPREIPELILTKNIYGLDIDDRAAQMAAFAVLMKAREDDKRIFSRDIKLNIHSIQSTENLNINQLWNDLDLDGNNQAGSIDDLFAEPQLELVEASPENKVYLDLLRYLKEQFIDAKNLGSLIEVDSQYLKSLATLQEKLAVKAQGSEPTSKEAAQALLPIVGQAIVLASQYDVAVANPPYMGSKGMNAALKDFAKRNYPRTKADLFSMMKERTFKLLDSYGYNAMIVMESWMFLSSFEKFRKAILNEGTVVDLIHMPYEGKGRTPLGINFGTSASIVLNSHINNYKGHFSCTRYFEINNDGVPLSFPTSNERRSYPIIEEFSKVPGSPIAYWVNNQFRDIFVNSKKFGDISNPNQALVTGNTEKYIRKWWEVDYINIGFGYMNREDAKSSCRKWFPYNKGGDYRNWYGNLEHVVNWENDGFELQNTLHPDGKRVWAHNFVLDSIFQEAFVWSKITSAKPCFRYSPVGHLFDDASGVCTFNPEHKELLLSIFCSSVNLNIQKLINPTLNIQPANIRELPLPAYPELIDKSVVQQILSIAKDDWESQEISSEFTVNKSENTKIEQDYSDQIEFDERVTNNMYELVQKNETNVYIAYGLEQPTSSKVELSDITINRNKVYRYNSKSLDILNQSQSDYSKNRISYAIGCMMGRYSLDREGLVYAHSGNNGFKELVAEGAYKTFPADDDGIVPLADEEWLFDDDATTRFREFVKTVWGEEHLSENLDFVAESLCLDAIKPKKGESSMETIRRYFSTQFFKDHLKTYKKRPIYWLFSSGKEKAFECLVYLHRYNEGTLSRMRTEYVTPLMGKLESRKNILEDSKATATGAELRAIDKELKTIDKKQAELVKFDEELKHLAEMKISIDLDDGVKVNYGKFGNLLNDVKAIHGKAPEKIK